jgi:hypothetical protein
MGTAGGTKSAQWILHDPTNKHPDSGNDLYRASDGSSTQELLHAQPFSSEAEAKQAAQGASETWQARRLSEFW